MRTQPITIVDIQENCTKYLLNVSFVSLLLGEKKNKFNFLHHCILFNLLTLTRWGLCVSVSIAIACQCKIVQWTRGSYLCVSLCANALQTAAICNNLAFNYHWVIAYENTFQLCTFLLCCSLSVSSGDVVWYTRICNWINENCFKWHLFTFNFSVPLQYIYIFKCKAMQSMNYYFSYCLCRWEWNCERRRQSVCFTTTTKNSDLWI